MLAIVAVIVRIFLEPARLRISLICAIVRINRKFAPTPLVATLLLTGWSIAISLVFVLNTGLETSVAVGTSAAQFVLLDPFRSLEFYCLLPFIK
jgi:hypothetical protein